MSTMDKAKGRRIVAASAAAQIAAVKNTASKKEAHRALLEALAASTFFLWSGTDLDYMVDQTINRLRKTIADFAVLEGAQHDSH